MATPALPMPAERLSGSICKKTTAAPPTCAWAACPAASAKKAMTAAAASPFRCMRMFSLNDCMVCFLTGKVLFEKGFGYRITANFSIRSDTERPPSGLSTRTRTLYR